MNVKKTSHRRREPNLQEKPFAADNRELPRDELPCTRETTYGSPYTRQVVSVRLANAPVLG